MTTEEKHQKMAREIKSKAHEVAQKLNIQGDLFIGIKEQEDLNIYPMTMYTQEDVISGSVESLKETMCRFTNLDEQSRKLLAEEAKKSISNLYEKQNPPQEVVHALGVLIFENDSEALTSLPSHLYEEYEKLLHKGDSIGVDLVGEILDADQ